MIKKKSKYTGKKGSLETSKTSNLIYLDLNKTYLEKYQIGKEASYFFVRRVDFPLKSKMIEVLKIQILYKQ